MNVDYNIDRKSASKLLEVSIRTVDRYIRDKKLSTNVIDGRIWLSKAEIINLISQKSDGVSTPEVSTVSSGQNKRVSIDKVQVISKEKASRSDFSFYKKMYEDVYSQLLNQQKRLEMANYRLGQLEMEVKSSIPAAKYLAEFQLNNEEKTVLTSQLNSSKHELKSLSNKLRNLYVKNKITFYLLLILLSLQPVWLYFLLIYS